MGLAPSAHGLVYKASPSIPRVSESLVSVKSENYLLGLYRRLKKMTFKTSTRFKMKAILNFLAH